MCGLIFSTNSLKHFSLCEELGEILSKIYIGLRVKYLLFLSDLNEPDLHQQIFEKLPKHEINENPSSRNRDVS
jgi:hypothetical protein